MLAAWYLYDMCNGIFWNLHGSCYCYTNVSWYCTADGGCYCSADGRCLWQLLVAVAKGQLLLAVAIVVELLAAKIVDLSARMVAVTVVHVIVIH